ncbi:hypothetical protein HK098_002293 [Nowakowskiella sp. JEL0407]|nr:hypothetical protein HK098_002293 [Nowakowskiella sp. JEL0407]
MISNISHSSLVSRSLNSLSTRTLFSHFPSSTAVSLRKVSSNSSPKSQFPCLEVNEAREQRLAAALNVPKEDPSPRPPKTTRSKSSSRLTTNAVKPSSSKPFTSTIAEFSSTPPTSSRKSDEGPEPAYSKIVSGFETFHYPHNFNLVHGGVLPEFNIAYETWGELNAAKDNVILLHTGLSASSHAKSHAKNTAPGWWENFIGPGYPLDTSKFFIICTNVLGGCYGSTGPSSINPETKNTRYGTDFPILTIFDMVKAQFKLLDHLGVKKLHASVGSSMGGMQSIAAASLFPDRVGRVISISGAIRSHPYSIAIRYCQRQVLMNDPNWNKGHYYESVPPHVGMKLARQIATISYRSGPEWEKRFGRKRADPEKGPMLCPDFLIETYLDHQGERFCLQYDANSLLYISKAMDLFDMSYPLPVDSMETEVISPREDVWSGASAIGKESEEKKPLSATDNPELDALIKGCANVQMPTLVLGVQSDILFPIWQQKEIADVLRAAGNKNVTYYELDAIYGHDTFLIDRVNIGGAVKGHLENVVNGTLTEYIRSTSGNKTHSIRHTMLCSDSPMSRSLHDLPDPILEEIFDFVENPQFLVQTSKLFHSISKQPIRRLRWVSRFSTSVEYQPSSGYTKQTVFVELCNGNKNRLSKFRGIFSDEKTCLFASKTKLPFDVKMTAWVISIKSNFKLAIAQFIDDLRIHLHTFSELSPLIISIFHSGILVGFVDDTDDVVRMYLSSEEGCSRLNAEYMAPSFAMRSPLLAIPAKRWYDLIPLFANSLPALFTLPDSNGLFPIHIAAATGLYKFVKELSKIPLVDLLVLDGLRRWTCLHFACQSIYSEVVKFIISEIGADAGLLTGAKEPALWVAIRANRLEIVEVLLSSGNIDLSLNWQDESGITVMHIAAKTKTKALKYLIDLNLDCGVVVSSGLTPLHSAVLNHDLNTVKALIDKFPAAVNALDISRNTPLINAMYSPHPLKCVQLLLKSGCDVNLGKPPLLAAVHLGNTELCEILLAHGANPNLTAETDGNTVFHTISRRDSPNRSLIKLLLAFGGNPYLLNRANQTALSYAAEKGRSEIISALMDGIKSEEAVFIRNRVFNSYKSSVSEIWKVELCEMPEGYINIADLDGNTALMNSILPKASAYIVEKLLSYGADVNLQNAHGETTLHIAIMLKKIEHMRALLRYPHDLTLRDIDGETAKTISPKEIKRMAHIIYADNATKLVRQCKRAENYHSTTRSMLPYDDETIHSVVTEMKFLSDDVDRKLRSQELARATSTASSNDNSGISSSRTLQNTGSSQRSNIPTEASQNTVNLAGNYVATMITSQALFRNKRALLIYLRQRATRITDLVWENGAVDLLKDNSARTILSPPEQDFLKGYLGLVTAYKGRFQEADLGAAMVPPKDVFVTVRVVKDGCGEVQTMSGPIRLIKNSQHYLRRSDIEHLITRGFLQHID